MGSAVHAAVHHKKSQALEKPQRPSTLKTLEKYGAGKEK